jgi:hypothetical protein
MKTKLLPLCALPGSVAVLALTGLLGLMGLLAPFIASAESALVINGRVIDAEARTRLESASGTSLHPGRWWYDARSGLWGREGQGATGFARPGLAVGAPLPPGISGGRLGVFFNGRELSDVEVAWLRTLGTVVPGRYWLDALGNVGFEGQPWAFANLWALSAKRSGGGAQNSTTRNGTWIASSGGCVIVSGKSSSGIGSFGASNC